MPYIKRDGKIYYQTVNEVEVDIAAEEYKLQVLKDALIVDAIESQERQTKFQEIDSTNLDETLKRNIKSQITYSGSGFTEKMVEEQQAKVSEIKRLNGDKF